MSVLTEFDERFGSHLNEEIYQYARAKISALEAELKEARQCSVCGGTDVVCFKAAEETQVKLLARAESAEARLAEVTKRLDLCGIDYKNIEREMTLFLGRPFKSHATDAVVILIDKYRTLESRLKTAEEERDKWKENHRIQCAINNAERNHKAASDAENGRLREWFEKLYQRLGRIHDVLGKHVPGEGLTAKEADEIWAHVANYNQDFKAALAPTADTEDGK
jgi:DNA replication initiation complex subunit (GINS family)